MTKTLPGFIGAGAAERLANPEKELLVLIFDRKRKGGLAWTLYELARVAGTMRDRISSDMWCILSSLDLTDARALADSDNAPTLSDVLDMLNRMVITLAAFGGLATDSMTRGQGWRFLDLGRRIECGPVAPRSGTEYAGERQQQH